MGKDCIVVSGEHTVRGAQKDLGSRTPDAANTSSPVAGGFEAIRGLRVIGSSEQVHVVDALAITGDEGRRSLR